MDLATKDSLVSFMLRYYGRKSLESKEDEDIMFRIHNKIFPENPKGKKENCDGCVKDVLLILQKKYEEMVAG